MFLVLLHRPVNHSQKQTLEEKKAAEHKIKRINQWDKLASWFFSSLVLKAMPLLSLTVNHEKHHGKRIPPAVFFNNNNRCPLRFYEVDKLLENKSWNEKERASYKQQDLSIYYTSIRDCNSKATEVRKAIKKTLRHNRNFHGESADYVIKQSLTNYKNPKQIYLNDHTFILEPSALYFPEIDRCCNICLYLSSFSDWFLSMLFKS